MASRRSAMPLRSICAACSWLPAAIPRLPCASCVMAFCPRIRSINEGAALCVEDDRIGRPRFAKRRVRSTGTAAQINQAAGVAISPPAVSARTPKGNPMNRNPRQHPAIAAANEFARNVMGDARICAPTKDDDISRAALEETAHFLGQLAQEMLAGSAPQPEQPARPLSDMVPRPEPQQATQPEDEQSAVAELLAHRSSVKGSRSAVAAC